MLLWANSDIESGKVRATRELFGADRYAHGFAGQTAFAPMRNKASNAAEAVNKAMSVYSIAMLRCPLFFERG